MQTHNHRSIQGAAESFGSHGANTVGSWVEEHDTIRDVANLRSASPNCTGDRKVGIDAANSAEEGEHLAAYDTLPCPPPDFDENTQ